MARHDSSMVTSRRRPRPHHKPHHPMDPVLMAAKPQVQNVEFLSVLRIRPLKKSEKEDHIVLEPGPRQEQHKSSACKTALLHPIIHMTSPDAKYNSNAPRKNSFDTVNSMFIKEGEEEQFHFDHVLGMNATQDKLHYSLGLGMALDAMEPLKQHNNAPLKNVRNHLVISMGVASTGKTYTTFGSQKATSSRTNSKHTEDGLVPRILESMFSQSKHHIQGDGNDNITFAVRFMMMHVQNDRVHDMLTMPHQKQQQHPEASPARTRSKKKSTVRSMVANFERGGDVSTSTAVSGSSGRTLNGMDEVTLEQDAITHDFIVNPNVRICHDVVDAREVLHSGLSRVKSGLMGSLVGGKSGSRGHTLVTIQPVLVRQHHRFSSSDGEGTIVKRCGGTITVLDMAGITRVRNTNRAAAGASMRDSIAINSSVSAVMHCLRTMKHNNDVISGDPSSMDIVCEDDEYSMDGSEISCVSEPKTSKVQQRLKKVPFGQSKLTMLLQPVFSPTGVWTSCQENVSTKTIVTMILAAYPGHRDYAEKRSLLTDFELLRGVNVKKNHEPTIEEERKVSTRIEFAANTGLEKGYKDRDSIEQTNVDSSSNEKEVNKQTSVYSASSSAKPAAAFNTINESPPPPPTAPSTLPASQVDDMNDLSPLPPPFAPTSQPPNGATAHPVTESIPPAREVCYPPVNAPSQPIQARPVSSIDSPPPRNDSAPRALPARATVAASPNIKAPTRTMRSSPLRAAVSSMPSTKSQSRAAHSPLATATPIAPSSGAISRSSPARASVAASPNIQPPTRAIQSPLVENVENKSPNRTWMKGSPMKTISKVVHASKKKGIRAMEKLVVTDKNVVDSAIHERAVAGRMQNSFKLDDKVEKAALSHRMQELEKRNAKLCEDNMRLEGECKQLKREKENLSRALRDAGRRSRQTEWTDLDEEDWHRSRRLRMHDQQLLRSPLNQHLEDVQATYDMNNVGLQTGKHPFELNFPSHWTRATDLDKRDRALQDMEPSPKTPAVDPKKGRTAVDRKLQRQSSEKRKQRSNSAFQASSGHKKKLKMDCH